MPLKVGHSLHECANLKRAEAIQRGDTEQQNSAESFTQLYQMQWAKKISSHALRTITERKTSQGQMLPLAEDIQKLHLFLKESAENLTDQLERSPDIKIWTQLARVTLAQLILFNRRRGGEAQRLLSDSYQSRSQNLEEDVARGLSDLERKLLDRFIKVSVMGKRGRPVAILLTVVLQNQIEVLMKCRSAVGILETNMFVFAQPGSNEPIRSSDCLRSFAVSCGAKKPLLITSTKLRKHVATLSQIMNLRKK